MVGIGVRVGVGVGVGVAGGGFRVPLSLALLGHCISVLVGG